MKTLVEFLDKETSLDAPTRHMDACAGVAILPTKYPFFRGCELAEQLCDAAKKSMRKLFPPDLDGKEKFIGGRNSSRLTRQFALRHVQTLQRDRLHGEIFAAVELHRSRLADDCRFNLLWHNGRTPYIDAIELIENGRN